MTCTKLLRPFGLRPEAGTTLVETLIALTIMTIVVAGVWGGWTHMQTVLARRDAVADGQHQTSLAMDRVTKYWNLRARPPRTSANMFPKFDADRPGFEVNSQARAVLFLSSDRAQRTTIATACQPTTSPALAGKDFSAASPCLRCPKGSAPYIRIDAPGARPVIFPPAVKGAAQTTVAMSACFLPWTFGNPLSVVFSASTLDPGGRTVMVNSKPLDLSVDNFAGVEINQ